jgi:hypothetical protein
MAKTKKNGWRGPHEAHAMGGRASSAKLTFEERQEKGRKAMASRWASKKKAAA